MVLMKRAFLIHGWYGNPNNHWFPWLALELKARSFDVSAPQMPHAPKPGVKEWLEFLKEYVGKPDKDTYFVGNSLGCIALVRYIELEQCTPSYDRQNRCLCLACRHTLSRTPATLLLRALERAASAALTRQNSSLLVPAPATETSDYWDFRPSRE